MIDMKTPSPLMKIAAQNFRFRLQIENQGQAVRLVQFVSPAYPG
jgi:hypothetical protein